MLAIGLIVAAVAVAQRGGDDDSDAARTEVEAQTTSSGAGASPTSTTTTAVVPTTLPDGALPTGCGTWDHAFDVAPDPVDGVAIYSDFGGWHIRLAPDGPDSVTGTVSGQALPDLADAPLPDGVEVTEIPEGATLAFTITADAEPTGFDFVVTCEQKQLVFALNGPDGKPLDPAEVQVGMTGSVSKLPVVAQRTTPPAG